MKKLIVGAAVLSALSMPALAADLPNVKGPPVYTPPPPVLSWTGFYVGGEVGARWTDPSWRTCLGPGAVLEGPSQQCTFPERVAVNNPESFNSLSAKGGPFVGFNYQIGSQWVVGVEGDWQFGDNRRTNAGIPGAEDPTVPGSPGLDSSTVRETWDASIRARAGFLVMPNLLLFGTGGAAFAHFSATASCATPFPVGWCGTVDPLFGIPQTVSSTRVGWTVGGGLEYMIAPNWLIRAEYRYADYGRLSALFYTGVGNLDAIAAKIRLRTNTASVGFAYKFDMFAPPAPVVAKY